MTRFDHIDSIEDVPEQDLKELLCHNKTSLTIAHDGDVVGRLEGLTGCVARPRIKGNKIDFRFTAPLGALSVGDGDGKAVASIGDAVTPIDEEESDDEGTDVPVGSADGETVPEDDGQEDDDDEKISFTLDL